MASRNHTPRWRSRMRFPKHDNRLSPKERDGYLRNLHGIVTEFMRGFIEDYRPDRETEAERSPLWTPLPWICQNLEISQAHLSRLMRELTGLNPIQIWDKLKLTEERIPLKYIELLQQFLRSLAPNPSFSDSTPDSLLPIPAPYAGNGSKLFWKWLKAQRNNPDFDRQALAREFGFPSASRFHRAFYFATNSTPREFENLIIRQAIDSPTDLEKTIASFKPKPPAPEPVSSPNERMLPREPERCYPPLSNDLDLAYLLYRNPDRIPVFNLPRPKCLGPEFPIILYKKPLPQPRPTVEFILIHRPRRKRRPTSKSAKQLIHSS